MLLIKSKVEVEKKPREEKWKKVRILSNAFDICLAILLLLLLIVFSIFYWWITIITLVIVGITIYVILKRNKKKRDLNK